MQHKAKCPHLWFMTTHFHKLFQLSALMLTTTMVLFLLPSGSIAEPVHGLAMHGKLKHPPDFSQFSYTSPDAKKGGRLNNAIIGTFDSLNPLISYGNPVQQVREYVYETLLARAFDEPFSLYGLIAEKIEIAEDRSWVAFTINKKARFSDGKPVTVDDVIFSHSLLKNKGRPNHRAYYSKVKSVVKVGDNTVRFEFQDGKDREIAMIMGLMPILPKHLIDPEKFDEVSLEIPVGSGPYVIKSIKRGKMILFQRNKDYWGKDLPVNKGRYNFDEVRIEYYRNQNSMFEGFKRGLIHLKQEGSPLKWSTAYNFPAIQSGKVVKKEVPLGIPSGMDALVFNTRRPVFADKRVRQALLHLFDAEWINKNMFRGLYTRTNSFFDRSELSSYGREPDNYEKELLAPFSSTIDKNIMAGSYELPSSKGSRGNRTNIRKALKLFKEAGYVFKEGKLINSKTNEPFTFEVLLATREQEKLILTYALTLKKIGIDIKLRNVDATQFESRKTNFQFDMIQNFWSGSLSPGNEQLFRWSADSSKRQGSYNFSGVKDPAVDAMIKALLAAKDRDQFVSSVRALDRTLRSGTYVIPLFHPKKQWVAQWTQLECPQNSSLYGFRIDTCWMK